MRAARCIEASLQPTRNTTENPNITITTTTTYLITAIEFSLGGSRSYSSTDK